MLPELRESLENLYSTFSGYKRGTPLTICRCGMCVSKEDEVALRTTPLRDISVRLIFEYRISCHDRKDAIAQQEQRFFLPRLLELIAEGRYAESAGDYEAAMALCPLRAIEWYTRWPDIEVQAVETYFYWLMKDRISCVDIVRRDCRDSGGVWHEDVSHLAKDADDVLVLIDEAGGDSTRAKIAWAESDDPAAAIHMAYNCREYSVEHLLDDDHFTRDKILARIEAALVEVTDEGLREILSDGLEAIGK
jgi:hypothetical protein